MRKVTRMEKINEILLDRFLRFWLWVKIKPLAGRQFDPKMREEIFKISNEVQRAAVMQFAKRGKRKDMKRSEP